MDELCEVTDESWRLMSCHWISIWPVLGPGRLDATTVPGSADIVIFWTHPLSFVPVR